MDRSYRTKKDLAFNWITTIAMAAFHIGAVAALFFFSWKGLFLALALWWVAGSWGIGMGYHRLLTHRGFKAPKWLEYFLTTCATLALEGGPIFWAPPTAYITSSPTKKVIRTRRAMASGGPIWDGSSSVRLFTKT
jgi:fatty-acid desaturase